MTNKIQNVAALVADLKERNRECASKGFVQSGNDAQRWLNYSKQLAAAQRKLKRLADAGFQAGELTIEEYREVVC